MATLHRVRVAWTGGPGGPGVSTFYFGTMSTSYLNALKTFYDTVKAMFPTSISIQVPGAGDTISDVDGKINGVWGNTAPAAVVGTSASGFPGPCGALVRWNSAGIVNGHHVVGKTYLVPLTQVYDTNGTLIGTNITTIQTAANTFLAAMGSDLKVFARPFTPKPGDDADPRDGSSYTVTSCVVPDKTVVLRSRRD